MDATMGELATAAKAEPVRCAYCGRLIRAKDQLLYPEDALCWKCLKDPGVTGLAKD